MDRTLTLPLSGGSYGDAWTLAPRCQSCIVVQDERGYHFRPADPATPGAHVSQASGHARTNPEGNTAIWWWHPGIGWQRYPAPSYVPDMTPDGVPAAIAE